MYYLSQLTLEVELTAALTTLIFRFKLITGDITICFLHITSLKDIPDSFLSELSANVIVLHPDFCLLSFLVPELDLPKQN